MDHHTDPLKIKSADFLFGAPNLDAIRKHAGAEVAVIGRSNVGKSTFINRMCRRKVARVSGNPGSTRELNFYAVNGAIEDQEFSITLVDMPGFGFAKLSKDEREEISRLAVSYLRGRKQLKAVILLNDCRRQPGEDERAIQGLCIEQGVRCIIVATKLDSIKRSQHQRALTAMAKGYHLERGDILATGEGIAPVDIWSRIVSLVS